MRIQPFTLSPLFFRPAIWSTVWQLPKRTATCLLISAAAVLGHGRVLHAETWNLGAGGSWNTAANWNPASVPNAIGAAVTFNGAVTGSNVVQTGNRTVTADAAQKAGSIIFNNDLSTFTTSITTGTGGSTLTFDETGSGPATITVPVAPGTGNNTISVSTSLADNLVANVNNITASSAAGALNLTATIFGAGGFTKNGDGLATFGTGAKTYGGPTVLNGGRIRISFAAAPTATSSFTINAGAQLNLISGATFTFGSGPVNLNGTGATSGPFAIFPGAIRNDRGNGSITINNAVVLQSDTLIHVQALTGTGASATPGATNTFAGDISGPGRLTLTAPGSDLDQGFLVLNGNNTYSGGSLVNGGILTVSGASATFGTGNVTVDNALSASSIARLLIRSGVLNAISDTATLSLAGGGTAGVADQGYAILESGVNEVVGDLKLAGVTQPPGTYGSTASAATTQNDEFFSGTGIITVAAPAAAPTLTIASTPPAVVLAWPTNATGYALQEVPVLALINNWSNVSAPVIIVDTNNTVTLTVSNTTTYFRLIK